MPRPKSVEKSKDFFGTLKRLLKNLNSWKYLIAGIIMFIPIFWMNQNLKDSWLMMGIEVIGGVIIYGVMVILLKAPIVGQAKELIANRLEK